MDKAGGNTLENILASACDEFLQKGFQAASLRNIVKKAGVTTGAFYGYFKSKEELFAALVNEQYEHMLNLFQGILSDFSTMPAEEQQRDMMEYTMAGVRRMTDYMYDNFDAFRLLLGSAEGTPYEDLIHSITQMEADATARFSNDMSTSGVELKKVNPKLEHILTSSMIYAYFEIILHEIPREEAEEYLMQLMQFYQAGWQKIMGF